MYTQYLSNSYWANYTPLSLLRLVVPVIEQYVPLLIHENLAHKLQ